MEPEEVLRLAAPCAKEGCGHFQGQRCKLGDNLVALLPVVSSRLPACNIRPDCVWWQQQGRLACMRCPQVVTVQIDPTDAARAAVEGHLAADD